MSFFLTWNTKYISGHYFAELSFFFVSFLSFSNKVINLAKSAVRQSRKNIFKSKSIFHTQRIRFVVHDSEKYFETSYNNKKLIN